jgi:hypothetical protein
VSTSGPKDLSVPCVPRGSRCFVLVNGLKLRDVTALFLAHDLHRLDAHRATGRDNGGRKGGESK